MNERFPGYSIQISTPDQFTPVEDSLGSSSHTWHGAAIMWHDSLNSDICQLKNTNDRFTSIKLGSYSHHILVISAYLPTSGKDDEFADCLAELSEFIDNNSKDDDAVLIGTDSNCSEKSTPRRNQAFQRFCIEHNLVKLCSKGPTFHHSNGISSSNIDFFLITQEHASQLTEISLQCNQDNPENFSSHDPVTAKFQLSPRDTNKQELFTHTYPTPPLDPPKYSGIMTV